MAEEISRLSFFSFLYVSLYNPDYVLFLRYFHADFSTLFAYSSVYLFILAEFMYLIFTRTPSGVIQFFVVVSLVCRALLFPFICYLYVNK